MGGTGQGVLRARFVITSLSQIIVNTAAGRWCWIMPDPPEFMRPAALYFGAHWMEQCKQAEARADKAEAALAKERARTEWWIKHRASCVTFINGQKMLIWHWCEGEKPLPKNQLAWKKHVSNFSPCVIRKAIDEVMEGGAG